MEGIIGLIVFLILVSRRILPAIMDKMEGENKFPQWPQDLPRTQRPYAQRTQHQPVSPMQREKTLVITTDDSFIQRSKAEKGMGRDKNKKSAKPANIGEVMPELGTEETLEKEVKSQVTGNIFNILQGENIANGIILAEVFGLPKSKQHILRAHKIKKCVIIGDFFE